MSIDRGVVPCPVSSSGTSCAVDSRFSTLIDRSTAFNVLSRNDSRGGEFGMFLGGEVGGVVIDDASDGRGVCLGDV